MKYSILIFNLNTLWRMRSLNWRRTPSRSNESGDFSDMSNSPTLYSDITCRQSAHVCDVYAKNPGEKGPNGGVYSVVQRFSREYGRRAGWSPCWREVGQLVREGRGFSWRAYTNAFVKHVRLLSRQEKDRSQTWPRDRAATAATAAAAATGETFLSRRDLWIIDAPKLFTASDAPYISA